jgi:rubrerythrin
MDETTRNLAEALKKAALAEREGQHFYRMAAASTEDEKGREVFSQLAEDEVMHEQWLKAHYDSVVERGVPAEGLQLKRGTDLSGAWPIFSESIKSRIKDAHFEMTALAVGIQLELNAVNFYRKCAEDTADSKLKNFFSQLAEWELGHYEALLRQQEALKGEYWAGSGFSPF